MVLRSIKLLTNGSCTSHNFPVTLKKEFLLRELTYLQKLQVTNFSLHLNGKVTNPTTTHFSGAYSHSSCKVILL